MRGFLLILLTQLLFLSCAIFLTASLHDDSGKILVLANWMHSDMGIVWIAYELAVLLGICILMRVCIHAREGKWRLLQIGSLVLYTISGALLICHLASLVICYSEGNAQRPCLASTPSSVEGRNAVYISTALLVPSFIFTHVINYESKSSGDLMSMRTIITNTLFILFATCSSICVIDDYVWDWKYAYTTLFTLGFTTYVSGFSTLVSFSQSEADPVFITLFFFLQPLLLLETMLENCLTS